MTVSLSLRCIKKKAVRWRKGGIQFRFRKKLIKQKESALTNSIWWCSKMAGIFNSMWFENFLRVPFVLNPNMMFSSICWETVHYPTLILWKVKWSMCEQLLKKRTQSDLRTLSNMIISVLLFSEIHLLIYFPLNAARVPKEITLWAMK